MARSGLPLRLKYDVQALKTKSKSQRVGRPSSEKTRPTFAATSIQYWERPDRAEVSSATTPGILAGPRTLVST